jgi:hypothetical protein
VAAGLSPAVSTPTTSFAHIDILNLRCQPVLMRPVPFDPARARLVYRRNLPHWRQRGAAYFVTFRLADPVPQDVVRRWVDEHQQWLKLNPPPRSLEKQQEQVRMFGRKLLKYLDTGHGSCVLANLSSRSEVEKAMHHFDSTRYLLGDYVIMPNHVHLLVMPVDGHDLTKIVASWTAYSAVRINRLVGRSGKLWQSEPFDHIVRIRAAYHRFVQYIKDNFSQATAGMATLGCGHLHWD